ncbi:MAG: sugar phosphate isomerase/epimerase [Kiritimatiellaeota bacterium]|nr:sugar phosphate isomerase/epimerase [Kiritimatiellota bacterium]
MKLSLALQLYSVRDLAEKDLPGTLKAVAEIGYKGVEFAGLYGRPAAEVRKMLDEQGLVACSAHCDVFNPAAVDQVMADARTLGYKHLVSGFGRDQFASDDAVKALADKINAVVDRYASNGLTVNYHNHWWEYDAANRGEKLLALCPKIQPQFDIYWIATGGAEPAKLIAKYAKRTSLLHIKDGPCVKGQPMTAVGQGKVDIKAAVKAAEKSNIKWGIVELDSCAGDMLSAVRASYRYLVENKLGVGRK